MTWPGALPTLEIKYVQELLVELKECAWLAPLVSQLAGAPLSVADKPLLFELRAGAHLEGRVKQPQYEVSLGVGDSSVDFSFESAGVRWFVELVSVMMSDAVKRATWERGMAFGASFSSDAKDQRESLQGELILVQQKAGEKVVRYGRPTKFGPPQPGSYQALFIDVRGFGLTGGDIWDYREIAYGHRGIPDDLAPFRHWWRDENGAYHPILGLFEDGNTKQRAGALIRERIHFLGFSWDDQYRPGSIAQNSFWCANPFLFASGTEARRAFETLPLRPTADVSEA